MNAMKKAKNIANNPGTPIHTSNPSDMANNWANPTPTYNTMLNAVRGVDKAARMTSPTCCFGDTI